MVAIMGLGVCAYAGVKYMTGSSFSDQLAIAQSINLSVAQCVAFGFIAFVLGGILLFAS